MYIVPLEGPFNTILVLCVCTHVQVHKDVSRERPEVGIECFPLLFSTLFNESASLRKAGAHQFAESNQTAHPRRCRLFLLRAGTTRVDHHAHPFL